MVDLVEMLEKRLDKTVLVEIETLLCRNPNCMLTAQDVAVGVLHSSAHSKVLSVT